MNRIIFASVNKKLIRILLLSFLFFCFFPYMRILPLDLDSQPNALILSVVVIALLAKSKVNKEIAWLLFVLMAAIGCMLFSNLNSLGIKILTNYLSLALIAYATYIALKKLKGIPYTFYFSIVCIWFTVALIQYTIYPPFLEFLLLRSSNAVMLAHGRGVTSLAVEPTFYGMICLLLLMINYLNFRERHRYWFINLLLLIQLILFSRSTTCMGIVVIAFSAYGGYMLLHGKHRFSWMFLYLILGILGYLIAIWMVNNLDIRAAKALQALLRDPSLFLQMDYSVNNRFVHMFFPIKGFIDNWGLPHGFGVYNEYLLVAEKDPVWNMLIDFDVSNEKKIPVSISASLFELGFFAFPIYYTIIRSFKQIALVRPNAVLCAFILFALMLNSMNFNQAILPMFIGNLIYLALNLPTVHCNSYRLEQTL